jgi:hypothetical protein
MRVAEPIQKAFDNLIPALSVPIVTASKTTEPAVNAFSFKLDAANQNKNTKPTKKQCSTAPRLQRREG